MENNNQESNVLKKVKELHNKIISFNQKMEEISKELEEKNAK
jgi:hypothetical protein